MISLNKMLKSLFVTSLFLGVFSLNADGQKIRFVNYEKLSTDVEKWAPDLIKDFEGKKQTEVQRVEDVMKRREKAIKDAKDKQGIANEKGMEEAGSAIIQLESEAKSTQEAAQYKMQLEAKKPGGHGLVSSPDQRQHG